MDPEFAYSRHYTVGKEMIDKVNDRLRKLLDNCDQLIKIPMLGKSDSLNLAVSTGIVLYESIRKIPN